MIVERSPGWFPRPFFPSLGWPSQELIIAAMVIGLFGFAFSQDPTDETMKGALIAGFAGAWGFFLGSSNGARRANDRADIAADTANILATSAAGPVTRTTTEVTGPSAKVPTPQPTAPGAAPEILSRSPPADGEPE